MRQQDPRQIKKPLLPGRFISGFTLMEIVVATTIFAFVATAMMSLFNYTLKINRKTEAVRQASQGIRTFVESFVKQVRNGQIYYGVIKDTNTEDVSNGPCGAGDIDEPDNSRRRKYYAEKENKIRIITTEGEDACFYLGETTSGNVSYAGTGDYTGDSLVIEKRTSGSNLKQALNPINITVDELAMFIRPVCDPYWECDDSPYSNDAPEIQPMAHISMKLKTQLPTGETISIYYQTAVSNNLYDIPSN